MVSLPKPAEPAPPVETPKAEPTPASVAEPVPAPAPVKALTEETLRNTAWASGKFRIDLSANGNVVIGNSARAKWKVEGDRLKLYSDTSDEVHYLDIRGDKLYWEGQEIGRAQ